MTHLKVTVNPSEQVIAKAVAEVTITDARGRSIKLKKPGVLAQFRLVEILGDTSKNETYMNMVLPMIYVAAIDDEPVYQPASKREVEALIQRLDEDGVSAVISGARENFGASDPEADKVALKK
jgi:hypothetical protein